MISQPREPQRSRRFSLVLLLFTCSLGSNFPAAKNFYNFRPDATPLKVDPTLTGGQLCVHTVPSGPSQLAAFRQVTYFITKIAFGII